MRVLKDGIAAKLEPHQRFFVELWYGMTHMQSLDTHRIRCLNARTVIRELRDEIRTEGRMRDEEFLLLCAEAKELLGNDPVAGAAFSRNLTVLQPLLDKPPTLQKKQEKGSKQEEGQSTKPKEEMTFALEDALAAFERGYFHLLCQKLPAAIRPGNEKDIAGITGALLSDLVDRGWTLQSLFEWHKHFIRDEKHYSFERNLDFMLRQIERVAQSFEVILRVTGGDELASIGSFQGFTLSKSVTLELKNDFRRAFAKTSGFVSFASVTVESHDHVSAAIAARDRFEDALDLLRFEFVADQVRIDPQAFVIRRGDNREEVVTVRSELPNPGARIGKEEFTEFARRLSTVLERDSVRVEDRNQIQAALRQYRYGRDSDGYRDKFMKWWTGLESICLIDAGVGIGPSVQKYVSNLMCVSYLRRLAIDLLGTLKYCRIAWPNEFVAFTGCKKLEELTLPQLVQILTSDSHLDLLWKQTSDYPIVAFWGKRLSDALASSATTRAAIEKHLHHLEWHLSRLYRIRCCIVHGGNVRHRLHLITANLEFYLKQAIEDVIDALSCDIHICSLPEVFTRGVWANAQTLASLGANGTAAKEVRSAVFSNLVLREAT